MSAITYVTDIIDKVGGEVYVTKLTKSSASLDYTSVLDNDAYSLISDKVGEELTTIITNEKTLFKSLPVLSELKSNPVVHHIDLNNFDFSIITNLRDLNCPIVISQNYNDLIINTKASYNLAVNLNKSVFHFIIPASYSKPNLSWSLFGSGNDNNILLPNVKQLSVDEILVKFNVSPFTVVNKPKAPIHTVLFLGLVNDDNLVEKFTKENVLLIGINLYKPFKLANLLSLIPSSVETLTVIQQTTSPSENFNPLLLDFFQDYAQYQYLKNFSKLISAYFGFNKDVDTTIDYLLKNINSDSPIQNLTFGKFDTEIISKSQLSTLDHTKSAIESAYKLEEPYLKLLNQVCSSNLNILNEFNASTLGSKSNPEFGFGKYLSEHENLQSLMDLVYEGIQSNEFKSIDNSELIDSLSKWLQLAKSNTNSNNQDLTNKILKLLESDSTKLSSDILALKPYFKLNSNWLIGSDSWSYDLGSSGVHNLISSGENVNMLIIDNQPYNDKINDKTINGYRKKDVGLYAMNYGDCYVASVAIYSSYTQVLQAFIEAEQFKGPSIVLAYLPYQSEFDNTLNILKETKKAVDTGYWPLYRYNPTSEDEHTRFKLDSSHLRNQLKDFLDKDNKLSLLAKKDPLLSRNLTSTGNTQTKSKQAKVADDSFSKLVHGLSGPPLTVAFASDGGNAEAVAKKINRQATARGLKSIALAMDDLSVEDLPTETNVVLVCSTSGQGEIPTNGKQFWDGLKNSVDLDLSSVHFTAFGMGDSEYWPRKEDKHYYNKPGKDLFNKFKLYGAQTITDLGLGDDQDTDGFNTGLNEWMPKLWEGLGVGNVEGADEPKPVTNEDIKIGSDYLRGTIAEGLKDQSTGSISAFDQQLTKFHGIYMQDDRDVRDERKAQGLEPAYAFMVRLRLPGGKATPDQYLKLDNLADERGNGTLKLTTRATFQLHGIVKHDLKPAIRGMNSTLLDTLAACGDVNRNVMLSALPHNATVHDQISKVGTLISEHLLPETTAYHEIWLEGEDEGDKAGDRDVWETRKGGPKKKKTLVSGNALVDHEPMYGATYLPRKFKIVITVPPYNDVDVYAHDIGLITIVEDNKVIGFNVLVGGGMGTTHNNKKTYPRTGSLFGFIPTDQIHIVCEKIMLVQRDNGDRANRKHARLKYTVDDLGVEVYKAKVEELLGYKFEEAKPFEIKSNIDYFGWCKDEFGLNHFTAFIENGRIEDTSELPQKTGLKKIAEYLRGGRSGEFRLTGNQHILVSNIHDEDLDHVKQLLKEYKLDNTDFSGLRLSSAACVAFPTCGLAMAESERYLPELISKLENALEEYGLRHDSVIMRMTGCPNGCARPWVAEVALVGKAYGAYNLMLGGGHHGQRLNKIYRYSIKEDEILDILKPLFKRWSLERMENEPFGDFCIRIGVIKPTIEGKYFHDDIPEEA